MFKKIAIATALVASASFATWDYFPVLEAGKGSAEAGLYYDWHHDWSQAGLKVGARYTLVQNLELSLQSWGYQFWNETDCDGCVNGGDGLRDFTIGGRYQFDPMVNAFLDLNLPLGGDEVTSDETSLYLGAQFSMAVKEAPGLKFGTEAGVFWGFEHDNNERGLELHLGGELDYTVPNMGLTPYVGLQVKMRLTESTWEEKDETGKEIERGANDAGDTQINLWLGAAYAINPQISFKGQVILRNGDHSNMGGDANGLYIACDFNF